MMRLGKTTKYSTFYSRLFACIFSVIAGMFALAVNAAPVLFVESELYTESYSEDVSGNVVNDVAGSVFNSQEVSSPSEIYNWTNQIERDFTDEYFEYLYTEASTSFSLDSSVVNSYEVVLQFQYGDSTSGFGETYFAGDEIDAIENYFDVFPVSQFYTFTIAPGELVDYLWFYEISGAIEYAVSATSSLNVVSLTEILPNQVSEPSLFALLLFGFFGLARANKRS